jgi:phosphoglycolate phosphatase
MRLQAVKAVLFDLDGTLVDSAPDLARAVDATLLELDRAPAGEARVREWVGNGAQRLLKRALTGQMEAEPPAELFERAMPRFFHHYEANLCIDSVLYVGVREGLQRLRRQGLQLAVVTNKPGRFVSPLLSALDIGEDFAVLVGGDTLAEKKPHPAPLLHAAKQLGQSPAQTLMVGDSRNDVLAARRAQMPVICVPYGYNHGEDIRRTEPDAVVEDLCELATLIERAL